MPDKTTSITAEVYRRTSTDPRVLVADGYGVTLRVERGHLAIVDGIGQHRRTRTLPRIERTVRRIIVLADTGYISWDAARWCTDVGITIAQVDRTARLITLGAAPEPGDARLRRAQAFAGEHGPHPHVGLDVVRYILARKLAGQAQVAHTLLHQPAVASTIREHATQLDAADTVRGMLGIEGRAAATYWQAWTGRVIVPFDPRDTWRVPAHWTTFTARHSPIDTASGNARHAADPINALLNYAYRLAEIECRLACLTLGLDPALGFLHADAQNRDSLALDLLEILRPEVDRYILGLLGADGPLQYLPVAAFSEARDGVCSLVAPLTHQLAEQALTWARIIAPQAEHLARTLAQLGRGEIRPAAPLTTNKTIMRGPTGRTSTARSLRLVGPVTVHRIVPDTLWHTIAPALPPNPTHARGGRPYADDRAVLAGIICTELLGCSQAKIPPSLGVSRYTCSTRLNGWRQTGAWQAIEEQLQSSEHVRQLQLEAAEPRSRGAGVAEIRHRRGMAGPTDLALCDHVSPGNDPAVGTSTRHEGEPMDPIPMIIDALTAGAVAGAQGTATQAVKDAYAGVKALVQRRFQGRPSAETAVEKHEARPEAWRGALEAELVDAQADQDTALVEAAQRLMELLDEAGARAGKYQVDVRGAQGVYVGDHGRQSNYFGAPTPTPRQADQ